MYKRQILGIAREVAVLSGIALGAPALSPASPAGRASELVRALSGTAPLAVSLQPGAGAGRLLTRIVRGLDLSLIHI